MRIAIYNEHWSTLGGGEQLSAGLATALAPVHDVDLLVHRPFDAARATERLGIDLTGLPQREIGDVASWSLLEASAGYDLLLNSSFASQLPSRARRSIYYVHFPIPHDELAPARRLVERFAGPLVGRGRGWVERRSGFFLREFPGDGSWTDGDARLDMFAPEGEEMLAGLSLDARFCPKDRLPRVHVTFDGRTVFDGEVSRRRVAVRTRIRGRGADDPIEVRVRSRTFVPRIEKGIDDDRALGVVVSRAFVGVPAVHVPSHAIPQWLKTDRFHPDFLRSYAEVAVNSPYTQEWVRRLWGRSSVLLAPPVRQRVAGAKDPAVLSVGRFFPNESGHSKKQLELARAFRQVVERRGLRGWCLDLVGGCAKEDRYYVDSIRREAVGLPVQLHVNARGEDLERLYARASIFWHAGGIGENPDINPDRFEHFGISVVEAMSAGAVPIVFSRGGPAAIVEPGVSGMHFSSVEELADATAALATDPGRLARLAVAARDRAGGYDADHFAGRVRELVERVAADVPAAAH